MQPGNDQTTLKRLWENKYMTTLAKGRFKSKSLKKQCRVDHSMARVLTDTISKHSNNVIHLWINLFQADSNIN